MNLQALRYFTCIAECGSFSAASELLHRSQPALSRGIQELEAELGVQLFMREGRRVTLSAEGASLLRHARDTLQDAQTLLARAQALRTGEVTVLRVGTAASTIEGVLPGLIHQYGKSAPGVELALATDSAGALLAALEQGELDVAITRHTTSELLDSKPLFPAHILAFMQKQHALAGKAALRIEDLASQRLMLAPRTATSRTLFDLACEEAGVRPLVVLEAADLHALTALSEVGYGIAIGPSTVSLKGRPVQAVPIQVKGHLLGAWTGVVWNRRRESDAVRTFVETAVRQHRRDYPGRELRLPPLPRVSAR